jgi:glycosyltransferase involved in cell wall biosynthesis
MLVTNVGGLPEIVPDGRVGLVCEPTVEGIIEGLKRVYSENVLPGLIANFPEERKRFSWAAMCDKLLEVYQICK